MAGYYEKIGNLLTTVAVDCEGFSESGCGICPHLELCRRLADIQSSADGINIMRKCLSEADDHDIRDFASAIDALISYVDKQKGDNA